MGRQQRISPALKVMIVGALGFGALAALVVFLLNNDIAVLNPQGIIAAEQRELFMVATILGLFVVIPVFVMTFLIVWRYRDTNKRPKKYSPNWDRSATAESLWWGIPIAIILILSVITWRSSHQLVVVWGFLFAAITPVRQTYLNRLIPTEQRATVLSFDSLLGSGGGVVTQPLLGRAADVWSYATSYIMSGMIYALALPFAWLARREAGKASASAADTH